jgi:hypothetical protein
LIVLTHTRSPPSYRQAGVRGKEPMDCWAEDMEHWTVGVPSPTRLPGPCGRGIMFSTPPRIEIVVAPARRSAKDIPGRSSFANPPSRLAQILLLISSGCRSTLEATAPRRRTRCSRNLSTPRLLLPPSPTTPRAVAAMRRLPWCTSQSPHCGLRARTNTRSPRQPTKRCASG